MGSESDYWQTPSDVELNEIQARRERSAKISKIMSDYLLKGYRMLATYCPECMNILMEDKQGRKFCIACEEIDKSETPPSTKCSVYQNGSLSAPPASMENNLTVVKSVIPQQTASASASVLVDDETDVRAVLKETKSVLSGKLRKATKQLEHEENSAACIDHASLIKAYAEALAAVLDVEKRQQ